MKPRSARQGFLGDRSEEILTGLAVAIVGNCGGGSHVAQQLAHVGIGQFVLVDPDVTESVNLNRMVGSTPADADAALQKTAVLRRLIQGVNPEAQVEELTTRWQDCALALRDCDLV